MAKLQSKRQELQQEIKAQEQDEFKAFLKEVKCKSIQDFESKMLSREGDQLVLQEKADCELKLQQATSELGIIKSGLSAQQI
jgi:hypothetical protein